MTISNMKLKELKKEERKLPLGNDGDVLGGVTATALNYAKNGEPRYCITICGSRTETKTYMSRIEFLKELEKRI